MCFMGVVFVVVILLIATRLPSVALPRGEAESCVGGPQKEMLFGVSQMTARERSYSISKVERSVATTALERTKKNGS
jgi:hypothetical protein